MELESMAVEMPEVEGHPNRVEFRGVLTVIDVPSQRAPQGSKGKRVVLTRGAAEAAIPSLLGMALDYAPSYDRHDVRRKVGVITSAEIVGRNLEVGGYLYAKDFPDVVEEVRKAGRVLGSEKISTPAAKGAASMGHPPFLNTVRLPQRSSNGVKIPSEGARLRAELAAAVERIRELAVETQGELVIASASREVAAGVDGLGMSYEVTAVEVVDKRMRLWTLTKVMFTGAAILRRDKAAYEDTWIGLV